MTKADTVRVALPMLNYVRGGMGGTETYAREVVSRLKRNDTVQLQILGSADAVGQFDVGHADAIKKVGTGIGIIDRLRTAVVASMRGPGLRRKMGSAEVFHYLFTAPLPRAPRSGVRVLTLHDVQHLDLPQLFSRGTRLFRRFFYDRAARHADALITVSEFAKERIVDTLGISPEKVHVIHLGVDTDAFHPVVEQRENFVLYPARGWPHKNHKNLVEAIELVREQIPDLRLVLTGGALDSLGEMPDWVDVRGLVSQAELHSLYQRASALVFPSRYEGFGLPPIEAMASGCPVVASRAGSIPEICGAAARFFDPDDPADIALQVVEMLKDPVPWQERGLVRAQNFSWDACAQAHVELYWELARQQRIAQ